MIRPRAPAGAGSAAPPPVPAPAAVSAMGSLPWPVWASLASNLLLFCAKLGSFLATGSLSIAASLAGQPPRLPHTPDPPRLCACGVPALPLRLPPPPPTSCLTHELDSRRRHPPRPPCPGAPAPASALVEGCHSLSVFFVIISPFCPRNETTGDGAGGAGGSGRWRYWRVLAPPRHSAPWRVAPKSPPGPCNTRGCLSC